MLVKIVIMQLAMGLLLGILLYIGIVSETYHNRQTQTGVTR